MCLRMYGTCGVQINTNSLFPSHLPFCLLTFLHFSQGLFEFLRWEWICIDIDLAQPCRRNKTNQNTLWVNNCLYSVFTVTFEQWLRAGGKEWKNPPCSRKDWSECCILCGVCGQLTLTIKGSAISLLSQNLKSYHNKNSWLIDTSEFHVAIQKAPLCHWILAKGLQALTWRIQLKVSMSTVHRVRARVNPHRNYTEILKNTFCWSLYLFCWFKKCLSGPQSLLHRKKGNAAAEAPWS